MRRYFKISVALLALLAAVSSPLARAAAPEKRFALVIGNASYKAGTLATSANDAAIIAQTLQAAGFDVIGARDLDGDGLRQIFRDFIDRVGNAGSDTVAAVYFAGYGLQVEGENYLVPVDADINKASDVSRQAVRLSEQMHALAALHLKASFVILDVARASQFLLSGQPPAGGLAWVEPETNMLIAFSAAPGTVSPDAREGYGPYAKALSETIREGSLTPAQVFDRARLRVNELTKGAQVPWDFSNIETQFMFFERGPGAPPRADSPERTARMRSQPMRSLGPNDAYMVTLLRDTFDAYTDFLSDYWRDPMTKRVRALLAVRREAITWRQTCEANTPDSYWSYLERYPRGSHVADARRLLTRMGAATALPPKFTRMEYDIPPPLPDEAEYLEGTVLRFDDPAYALELPPPSPVHFLDRQPPEFMNLAPPVAPSGAHNLATPMIVSLPDYISVPAYVAPPLDSPILNRHAPAVNANAPAKSDGKTISSSVSAPSAVGKNSLAEGSRLPPSVAIQHTLNDGVNPLPLAANPATREMVNLPQSMPAPAAMTPTWATLNPAVRQKINELPSPSLPPIASLPVWVTDYKTMANPGTVRAVPAPRPTVVPLPSRRPAIRSVQASGSVPPPIPAALTAGDQHTPITHPASVSPPKATSSVDGLAPPVQRRAKVAPGAASAKPPARKPCPLVDGLPSCS
jgi:uncharacterized caspase-like protein